MHLKIVEFDFNAYVETGCRFPVWLSLSSGEAIPHSIITPAGEQLSRVKSSCSGPLQITISRDRKRVVVVKVVVTVGPGHHAVIFPAYQQNIAT